MSSSVTCPPKCGGQGGWTEETTDPDGTVRQTWRSCPSCRGN
ncbi:hypothetical protein ACFW9F_27830 [Streptomyces sp. NPDC059506]